MSTILVAYGTGEGQTAKVARYVAEELEARGHEVTTWDLDADGVVGALDAFDAVVVGASIHMGAHQDAVVDFASEWRAALAGRPTGFFQVSLSSASEDAERQAEAVRYLDEFGTATGWKPDVVAGFAGALRYSAYGFLKRSLMKRIAKDATGDTDASRDYEYTDWDDVAAFADAVDALLDGERVEQPPLGEEESRR